ncbi:MULTISPECIES: AAA family ATPase [Vibrio]|uniref:AAA family ATPase n=1 Tax=Vibrio TaxID=662 RepID=UPI0009807513|nr:MULTISPECIES: AAA family ATPase [Vibrio]EHH1026988.1 AAA family ATPase [Vibrio parahaemolyticus]AQP36668.1 hypothetical protein AA909_09990 [Vibrio anguillarum]EHR1261856.1 AAA family ATPase [Vibrio parahaemolyticus]EJG1654174.1 AAA family ATPase [Vibrio parahaemolyticus]MCS0206239.1 AAA family ATPase [Vibrio sp. HS-50-1]
MNYHILFGQEAVPHSGVSSVYLTPIKNEMSSFSTLFNVSLHDDKGLYRELGLVKIGVVNQISEEKLSESLPPIFERLGNDYFSLGIDVDYYSKLAQLPSSLRFSLLRSLNDIVYSSDHLAIAQKETVFRTDFLASVSLSSIKGQFSRVLKGGVLLTDYSFSFNRSTDGLFSAINLGFEVNASSVPSTNIHAVIGRNGVGKTTLLNGMVQGGLGINNKLGFFIDPNTGEAFEKDYFSCIVSVSFSAFDTFTPPEEQQDPSKGIRYYYVGLKSQKQGENRLKTRTEMDVDFNRSFALCLGEKEKKVRLFKAIKTLESDENFAEMNIRRFELEPTSIAKRGIWEAMTSMSSGHAVVLQTLTRLVASVEEKTLVLIDEPESHLHPPLLSAFIRALSELLHDRNGVAIIATHSPVVLQEVPKSCVWKVLKSGDVTKVLRPEIETFGENVGILTREVFGLEVTKSGFHKLLSKSVDDGFTYEEILNQYNNQLGFEARAILKALLLHKEKADIK